MFQSLNVFLVLRGPKMSTILEVQPHQCSVQTVLSTEGWLPPCSCWPHYFQCRPRCCWPSSPPGLTVSPCSEEHQPTPPGPFRLHSHPATQPQACSAAWGYCGQSAKPGTWPCWTSAQQSSLSRSISISRAALIGKLKKRSFWMSWTWNSGLLLFFI